MYTGIRLLAGRRMPALRHALLYPWIRSLRLMGLMGWLLREGLGLLRKGLGLLRKGLGLLRGRIGH